MSRGRIIGLISGKGGVGKTSLSVNLGVALTQLDQEVTLVDADFAASNLGVHLGRYEHPVKMQDVLRSESTPEKAIFRHPTGIKAIVSSNDIQYTEPDTSRLREVLEVAAKESDYVIVDCPPGIDSKVESIMEACDELLIVTAPTQTAGINAAQIIEKAKELKKPVLGTVVNKVEDDPEMELVEREVEIMTESHIMAQIPYDKEMKKSLFEKTPLVFYNPLSRAALSISELAAKMEGKEFERPQFAKLKRIFRKFKDSME